MGNSRAYLASAGLAVLCRLSLIVSSVAMLLAGCDTPIDQFRPNDVYALTLERSRNVSSEASKRDTARVVTELFGTPDDPKWPRVWLESDAADRLVDDDQLVRSAGAVSSERDGTHRGLFREHCVACHGVSGDGAGPASSTQNPYPRDFRLGVFKWKSSARAEKPTREDLESVLKHGIPGTGMPSFSLLVPEDLQALTDYVIYLAVRGEVERRLLAASIDELGYDEAAPDDAAELAVSGETDGVDVVRAVLNRVANDWAQAKSASVPQTWRDLDGEAWNDSVARGETIFHGPIANCVGCHGRGGNGHAVTLDFDDWTKEFSTRLGAAGAPRPRPIEPRNLQDGVFRGGRDPETLYRRITQGIAGTPMPAVAVVDQPDGTGLTTDQVWDLVRYLHSLGESP